MPANPFPTIATDLTIESGDVLAAFTNATIELNAQSATDTFFLEICYSGGKILRTYDGQQINGLPADEQLRLYPQLFGLFNLAMKNVLY